MGQIRAGRFDSRLTPLAVRRLGASAGPAFTPTAAAFICASARAAADPGSCSSAFEASGARWGGDDPNGEVVFDIDADEYSPSYPKEQWSYLIKPVLRLIRSVGPA